MSIAPFFIARVLLSLIILYTVFAIARSFSHGLDIVKSIAARLLHPYVTCAAASIAMLRR